MENKKLTLIDYFIATMLAAIIIVVVCQVVWRYLFNNSLSWTEEISRYMYVWVIFIGAAVAIKEGTHIGIDYFLQKFKDKGKRRIDILLTVFTLLLLGYFEYYGIKFVIATNNTFSTALSIPLNIFVYSAFPISCLLGMYFCIRRIVTNLRIEIESYPQIRKEL